MKDLLGSLGATWTVSVWLLVAEGGQQVFLNSPSRSGLGVTRDTAGSERFLNREGAGWSWGKVHSEGVQQSEKMTCRTGWLDRLVSSPESVGQALKSLFSQPIWSSWAFTFHLSKGHGLSMTTSCSLPRLENTCFHQLGLSQTERREMNNKLVNQPTKHLYWMYTLYEYLFSVCTHAHVCELQRSCGGQLTTCEI